MQAHAEEAWAETRNLMYRHPLLVTYAVIGILLLAVSVSLSTAYWDLMMMGYLIAGCAILLEYAIRGR